MAIPFSESRWCRGVFRLGLDQTTATFALNKGAMAKASARSMNSRAAFCLPQTALSQPAATLVQACRYQCPLVPLSLGLRRTIRPPRLMISIVLSERICALSFLFMSFLWGTGSTAVDTDSARRTEPMIATTCSSQRSTVDGTIRIVASLFSAFEEGCHSRIHARIAWSANCVVRTACAVSATDIAERRAGSVTTILSTRTRIGRAVAATGCKHPEQGSEHETQLHGLTPKMLEKMEHCRQQ